MATETTELPKPKYLLPGPLQNKSANPCPSIRVVEAVGVGEHAKISGQTGNYRRAHNPYLEVQGGSDS